jgi:hypothetical protein
MKKRSLVMTDREIFEGHLRSQNFEAARNMLVKEITFDKLEWEDVKTRPNGGIIQVCRPVRVKGPDEKMYYVPVRPSETWKFAHDFNALPLTSAVFDLYSNQSQYVPRSGNHDAFKNGDHFHTFSEYLNKNKYHEGKKSGAHKLWILSALGRSVNRGLYFPKPRNPQGNPYRPAGRNSPSYWVMNDRGTKHGGLGHWDYSQLLQLMRSNDNFGREKEIKVIQLRDAVLDGVWEVWDEPQKMRPELMP